MADVRPLNFATEADAIADIERLRKGYIKSGNWSLAQIAYHVGFPIAHSPTPPQSHEATADQKPMQAFLEKVVANGWPASKLDSSAAMSPPDEPSQGLIDELIQNLKRLAAYNAEYIDAGPFGPVLTSKYRRFQLIHIAHHLAFLKPNEGRRTGLKYASEADVIADVKNLQRGYKQSGNWNLQQVCWHLAKATEWGMRPGPFPENTPEQNAFRPMMEKILATSVLPTGLQAPEQFLPPADCGDAEIDHLAAALEKAKNHPGPFAPHRLFGKLTPDEARTLRLAHCAHHLSHLIPTNKES